VAGNDLYDVAADLNRTDADGRFVVTNTVLVSVAERSRVGLAPAIDGALHEGTTMRRPGGKLLAEPGRSRSRTRIAQFHEPHAGRCFVVADILRIAVTELAEPAPAPAPHSTLGSERTTVNAARSHGECAGPERDISKSRCGFVVTDILRIAVT
jgi:hypothetical protein